MSFPNALRPAARSAYRSVIRSARITFKGDPERHLAMVQAVRQTFSSPTMTPPKPSTPRAPEPTSCSSAATPPPAPVEEPLVETEVSEGELEKRIGEWKEIALFLRRNVVQGEQGEDGAFRLRVTEDTELGDNETTKLPPKLPTTPFPNRNRRRRRTAFSINAEAEAEAKAKEAAETSSSSS